MKKRHSTYILIIVLFLSYGCTETKSDSPIVKSQFSQNRSTNNLDLDFQIQDEVDIKILTNEDRPYMESITKKRTDISFTARRIDTKSYLIAKGVDIENDLTALSELEDQQLFYFDIEESLKQDVLKKYFNSDMDKAIQYLSFKIQEDFRLINSKGDTIRADYAFHESSFHLSPYERILVSFSKINEGEALEMIYRDNLFQKGQISFHFPSQNLLANTLKSQKS